MFRPVRYGLLALGAGLLAIAACNDATSPGLTVSSTQISDDAAVDVGDAAANTADVMVASEALYNGDQASGDVVPGSAAGGSTTTCGGPNSTGWFTCTSDTEKGLSVTRSIRFWAAGSFGLAFNAQTDSVNHILFRTGTLTPSASRTQWINRGDTLTMVVTRASANVAAARTWTGHGTRTDSSAVTDTASSRHYHYTMMDTVTAVAYAIPRSSNPYPNSGSIVHNVTVVVNATKGTETFSTTTTRRAVVTFNGTVNASLTIGGLTCSLNLSTHAVTGCQ